MRNCIASVVCLLVIAIPTVAAVPTPGWTAQRPDMVNGYGFSSEIKVPSIVADDWNARTSDAINGIRWWGTFWPTGQGYSPNSDALGNVSPLPALFGFRLKLWTDVPSNPGQGIEFSRPGTEIWTFDTTSFNQTFYGTTSTGGRNVYQYYVALPENKWFQPTPGTVYWLSIQAFLDSTSVQWGWHESNSHWNDAAVQDFRCSGWYALGNNLYDNDMAFEFTVVPEPSSLAALATGLVGIFGWSMKLRRRK